MATRIARTQSEHDRIVALSASFYEKYAAENGYVVSTNPDGEHNWGFTSGSASSYPDVVVWQPESPGANRGTAKIIEEIETADSVTEAEAAQWAAYAAYGVGQFLLVVPVGCKAAAAEIVRKKGIQGITKIQGYWFVDGSVKFD